MGGSAEDRWLLCCAPGLTLVPRTMCSHPSPPRTSHIWLQCSSARLLATGSQSPPLPRLPPLAGMETSWLSSTGHTGETPSGPEMVLPRKHHFFAEDQVVCNSILVSNLGRPVQCRGSTGWGRARLSPCHREVVEVFSAHSFVVAQPKQS